MKRKKPHTPPDFIFLDESHPITDEVRARVRALSKPPLAEILAFYRSVGLGWIKP